MSNEMNQPAPELTPQALVAELCDLLEVEEIDRDLYRGKRKKGGVGRIFGGQVIAQALMAACRSIEEQKTVHSLHAYFMRPGDEDLPIIFRVERDFDGGTFANRRVIAIQKGQPILNFAASFQTPEAGMSHSIKMPEVPPPDGLLSLRELAEKHAGVLSRPMMRFMGGPKPIELRPIQPLPFVTRTSTEPFNQYWFRAIAPVPGGQQMHRVILAHISDMMLLGASMRPHIGNLDPQKMQTASLDHALWFHEDVQVDDWLLYATESPWAGHARGFCRGSIFTRDGMLVASVTQEGLIRQRR